MLICWDAGVSPVPTCPEKDSDVGLALSGELAVRVRVTPMEMGVPVVGVRVTVPE